MKTIIISNENYSVIDLTREYEGWTGKEKFGVITHYSKEMLEKKFSTELASFSPYVILPESFLDVRRTYRNNDKKFEMREQRYHSIFEYEEDLTESQHHNLIMGDFTDEWIDSEIIRSSFCVLTDCEKTRLKMRYKLEMTLEEIGKKTGSSPRAVKYSIDNALKKIKKFLENDFKNDLSQWV